MDKLLETDGSKMILGSRCFESIDIPWKSRLGNLCTEKVFSYAFGFHVRDTQTGLRGIPMCFMQQIIDVPGDRFEYEMRMLIEAVDSIGVEEVPIETVYESKTEHQTHFRPVKDSAKIYAILLKTLIKYSFVSLSSFALDIIVFSLLCSMLKFTSYTWYIVASTVIARVISAVYNFFMNYRLVFESKKEPYKAGCRYFVLALAQMLFSAVIVDLLAKYVMTFTVETVVKIFVDTCLSLCSYYIQRKYVF